MFIGIVGLSFWLYILEAKLAAAEQLEAERIATERMAIKAKSDAEKLYETELTQMY